MITRRRLSAFALTFLVVVAAACGDDAVSERDKRVNATTTSTSTTTTVPPPIGRPSRIVSLSPTATETLFAIGAGDQVVAVDSYSTYPPEAPITDLSAYEPNVEAITSYDPDLVITDGTNQQLLDQLNTLGIATLAAPAPKTLTGAFEQMETLGASTGNIAQAAALVVDLEAQVKGILDAFPDREGTLTYYYELDPTFFTASSKTFIGAVLGLLGMENIADEVDNSKTAGYPQLTPEFIVQANPDVIVLADTKFSLQTLETVSARPGWSEIRAVVEGNILELDDDIASRWGPRIVELLQVVAKAVQDIEPIVDDSLSS